MRFPITSCILVLCVSALPVFAGRLTSAQRLAGDISSEASLAAETAFRLSNSRPYGVSPESQAIRLNNLRDRVNAMGKDFAQLKAMNPSYDRAISRTLQRAEQLLRSIAAETTGAIEFYNNDRNRLWTPDFADIASSIEDRAAELHQLLDNARDLSVLRSRETALRHDLGQQLAR